jgi:hypothetical protein
MAIKKEILKILQFWHISFTKNLFMSGIRIFSWLQSDEKLPKKKQC